MLVVHFLLWRFLLYWCEAPLFAALDDLASLPHLTMAQRSDIASPDDNASCIRITDAETGTPYYVSAEFQADANGEECFELRVTDLKRAWAAAGAPSSLMTSTMSECSLLARKPCILQCH